MKILFVIDLTDYAPSFADHPSNIGVGAVLLNDVKIVVNTIQEKNPYHHVESHFLFYSSETINFRLAINDRFNFSLDNLGKIQFHNITSQDSVGLQKRISELDRELKSQHIIYFNSKSSPLNAGPATPATLMTRALGDLHLFSSTLKPGPKQKARVYLDIDGTLLVDVKRNQEKTVINPLIIDKLHELKKTYETIEFIILSSRFNLYPADGPQFFSRVERDIAEVTHPDWQNKLVVTLAMWQMSKKITGFLNGTDLTVTHDQFLKYLNDFNDRKQACLNEIQSAGPHYDMRNLKNFFSGFSRSIAIHADADSTISIVTTLRTHGIPVLLIPEKSLNPGEVSKELRFEEMSQELHESVDVYFFENDPSYFVDARATLSTNPKRQFEFYQCIDADHVGIEYSESIKTWRDQLTIATATQSCFRS